METVAIDAIEPVPEGDSEINRRPLTEPLGTTDLAANYYVLEPGESFVGGLHAHMDQEEVFVVFEGTMTFETTTDPAGEHDLVVVGPRETIRFGRGEYQEGRNDGDERAVVLALGAPRDSTAGRVPRTCPDCGDSEYQETVMIDGTLRVQCPSCEVIHDSGLH